MIEISLDRGYLLDPLFTRIEETCVWSYTQGHMGRGWLDRRENPTCARIIMGDFCYLAGDPHSPCAGKMIRDIPEEFADKDMLMIADSEQWEAQIQAAYKSCFRFQRYAIKKDTVFDRAKLQAYVDRLPSRFTLKPIDEALYHRTLEQSFSRDFCSQFESAADFAARGLGYAVLHGDELVGGASSYSIYNTGIEIEIDVKESHRRLGLATACGAKLILACLDRGKYPSWDAATKISVALAEKLGYEFDHAYNTFAVRRLG